VFPLLKHYATKLYGGVDEWIHIFFYFGTSWRWVVSFTPRPLCPVGCSSSTHYIGSWLDPRTGLEDAKRKFLNLPGLELRSLGRPAGSQSLYIAIHNCHLLIHLQRCQNLAFNDFGKTQPTGKEMRFRILNIRAPGGKVYWREYTEIHPSVI
jgi:hypothetical protein